MRHLFALLIGSFILVNVVSGYLNADPAAANAATIRSELKNAQEQWQISRVSRSLTREEHSQ